MGDSGVFPIENLQESGQLESNGHLIDN